MYQQQENTIKIVKLLRSFFQKFDFFSASQFLRYKGQSEYRTVTGGFVSIIIIVIFFIVFTSSGINMVNKANVTSTSTFEHQIISSASNVTIGPGGNFMFAINIFGINFSNPNYTAFQVVMQQEKYSPNALTEVTEVPLSACTLKHLAYGSNFQTLYKDDNLSEWLCPPINYQFSLQGKLSSPIYEQLSTNVKKCNSTRHNNCLSDAQVNNLQNKFGFFNFFVVIINIQLNPSQSQSYKRYYVQDRNHFKFSTSLGILAVPQVQQYQISTDNSLLPFLKSQKIEDGLVVTDIFQTYPTPVYQDIYVTVSFRKSPQLAFYNRTFEKIDEFLSYGGGLIGTIMGLFFFLNKYNEMCYLISVGNKLFLYDKETKIDSDQFNIIHFVSFIIYQIVSFFGCLKTIYL